MHEFGYLLDPEPLGDVGLGASPGPEAVRHLRRCMGEPSGPALGTETGLAGKIKDALT